MTASTNWKERIAPDEAKRFEDYARDFAAMQARKSVEFGAGRALHRKQILAAKGTFEVLADLPEPARHGLFATPGIHDAWLRLSNGSAMRQADRKPDIRGFAIKVLGVTGVSALGDFPATAQDFSLINRSVFGFKGSADFVGLALAAGRGGGALIKYLVRRHGLFGGIGFIASFARNMSRPFAGFAAEPFHSAVPIACGPYACRLRLAPLNAPAAATSTDWRGDFSARLAGAPLAYDFQLQFFVDEARTPIEDASVDWLEADAPYVTVARLTLPVQAIAEPGQGFDAQAEAAFFDPWNALAEHRPLGDVMRARKVIYFASERARGAAGG